MQQKLSALVLSMFLATSAFTCEAAKLTKAQMEDIYNNGGTVSTKPSTTRPVLKTNVPVTQKAPAEKPKVEVKEAPAPVAKEKPQVTKSSVVSKSEQQKQQKVKPSKTKKTKITKNEQKQNSSSWRVKVAQRNLRVLGLSNEASTGKLTATTKEAIVAFQKKFKLDANGELNDTTYSKLNWEAFVKTGIKNIKGSDIVAKAAKYKGVPYVFGGTTPKGFDCSGYVQYVFKQLGGNLTRTADTQAEEGIFITQKQLKPGDLVFFTTYEPGASHVGIYAGNGKFWNASSSRGVVLYGLSDDYWRVRYYGARRVLVSNGEIK